VLKIQYIEQPSFLQEDCMAKNKCLSLAKELQRKRPGLASMQRIIGNNCIQNLPDSRRKDCLTSKSLIKNSFLSQPSHKGQNGPSSTQGEGNVWQQGHCVHNSDQLSVPQHELAQSRSVCIPSVSWLL
jgi:hypothetical protein